MLHRTEEDSLGKVSVPSDKYWGAQTQRSILNFSIGHEKMPAEVIRAITIVKLAAARTNVADGMISKKLLPAIEGVCGDIIAGRMDDHFPLFVWQTGSGTQSNMNVNEVISNKAIETLGGKLGSKDPLHPNDHVNMCQSSNDTFPSAMRICAAQSALLRLFPCIDLLTESIKKKSEEFCDVVKVGRTHMQDATPISLGQEFSCYFAQLTKCKSRIKETLNRLYELPQGGTAVGTGINTKPGFDKKIVSEIAKITKIPFVVAQNKFELISAHDSLVELSGNLNVLATTLMKIANDIRLLSSGPRCSIGEISLPANEPGSSIMPGKVNPTQCEALTMICAQVMGNHVTVTIGGSNGHLQLNAFNPVIIYNVLQSVTLLSDGIKNFSTKCIDGIKANTERIKSLLNQSLMLVTALNKHIGYDNAAKIAKFAHQKGLTLKQSALELNLISAEEFDRIIKPEEMLYPA